MVLLLLSSSGLNAAGWNVPAIAHHLQLHEHTVRHALKRWQAEGLAGLWDAPRSGRPRCWQASDWEAVEAWLQEPRSYTSRQLCENTTAGTPSQLESASDVARAPKKGYRWKRLRYCPCPPKDPVYAAHKRADWQLLKQWAEA
ncbi:MAG: helix-turn-helix domain-containing protein, partial [Cyanobacteria bacterium P01_H01_bin.152]